MSSKEYEIKSREDIIAIPDVKTCHKFARSWGLSIKGLRSKDDIIKVLLKDWDEKNCRTSHNATDCTSIEDIVRSYQEKRELLHQKFFALETFYHKLNDVLKKDIESVFPDFMTELKSRHKQLLSSSCYILVAGDTVSGKSSFINLVLGTDILPTQQLSCSATICELKHSRDGETHFADLYRVKCSNSTKLDLKEDEKQDFRELKSKIQELVEDESPFERIEIFWPFDFLKSGIVLVDTPGIGENGMMFEKLKEYMNHSFGFIYIIDSAQATGLQKGRLTDFLRLVMNSSDNIFDPRATLFVCNKWDTVPPKEQSDIKQITIAKLRKIFPKLENEQVFTLSTLLALKSASFNSVYADFSHLFENGIKKLIPASVNNKLLDNYRWLKQVLQRVCYSLKITQTIGVQKVKTNNETIDKLKNQLEHLNNNAEDVLESAKGIVEDQIDLLHKRIADFLRSREALDQICSWVGSDCPKHSSDVKKVIKEASETIGDRIMQVIDAWEKQNQFVVGLQDTIIQKVEEEFQLMDSQMKEVEGVLRISGKRNDFRRSISARMLFASRHKPSSSGVDGVGSAVSSAGSLSSSDRKVKDLFRKHKNTSAEERMMKATIYYIENIFTGKGLRNYLSKFLKRLIQGLDSIAEKIPQFIQADHDLIWQLELDLNESRGALKNIYPKLSGDAKQLHGQLDMFYVTHLLRQDYDPDAIKWQHTDLICSGAFSNVYKALLKVGHDDVNLSVKVTTDRYSLQESTVTDILLEDETLRVSNHENMIKYHGILLKTATSPEKSQRIQELTLKALNHKNIIKYHGTLLKTSTSSGKSLLQWVMILEHCNSTLKDICVDGDFHNPARVRREKRATSIQVMAQYITQLCAGLAYLHSKNLINGDLRLENVLVSREKDKDVIKLKDVGITKQENISGTFVGTPVHVAPEIILNRGMFDKKSDIYSLAIILWEIWYGLDASKNIHQTLQERNLTFEKALEIDKLRPSLDLEVRPSIEIEDIIVKCWDENPKNRLDAGDVEYFFQTYLE